VLATNSHFSVFVIVGPIIDDRIVTVGSKTLSDVTVAVAKAVIFVRNGVRVTVTIDVVGGSVIVENIVASLSSVIV
jgi:hypothetical protein